MVTFTLRFEEEMKKELDEMVEGMGMTLTTFFMIYAKEALKRRSVPFRITSRPKWMTDKQYQDVLDGMEAYARGDYVTMTVDDLDRMIDEAERQIAAQGGKRPKKTGTRKPKTI